MPSPHTIRQGLDIAGIRFEIECDEYLLHHLEPKLNGFYSDAPAPYKLVIKQSGPENAGLIHDEIPSIICASDKIIIEHPGIFRTEFCQNSGMGQILFRHRPGDLDGTWPPRGPWMGLKSLYATLLLKQKSGVMVHAGGVFKKKRAVVFLGHSGAGKSTITALLESAWGEASVLNDESIALTLDQNSIIAHSTPFSGLLDRKRFRNCAPTHQLINLIQAPSTELKSFPLADRLRLIMECTVLPPGDSRLEQRAFEMAVQLAKIGNWNSVHFRKSADEISQLFEKELERG